MISHELPTPSLLPSRELALGRWKWNYGKPAPLWITQLRVIEDTIHEMHLKPLPRESYPNAGLDQGVLLQELQIARLAESSRDKEKIIAPDFPGGLKSPHLHFKRDLYLLDDEQWNIFSNNIVRGFKEKLSKIGTVGFEQLLDTSEAIDSLV
jgi:hypothetical protein